MELEKRQREKTRQGIAYNFRGNAAKIFDLRDPEIILSGPRETSKTVAWLSYLNKLAWQYPGMQGAIIRKVRADMDGTVLETFNKKIIAGSEVQVYGGSKPERYIYPTGSVLWVGGMDHPGSALSGERDIVYVNQAEELVLEDWETLTGSTTGRAGNMPFSLLGGDCNPRGSNHWIPRRAKEGKLTLLPTYHKDNPALFDDSGSLTEQGKRTISRLQNLTGVRRKRWYEGLWVTPEGAVYDTFSQDVHVKHRNREEFKYWALSLDEGYTHPAVTLLIGVDSDLRVHIMREFYKTGILPSQHTKLTTQWANQYHTHLIIVDSAAAGLIAELANYSGLQIEGSKGHVREGIALVHEMLAVQKDGKPRLTVEPECKNTIAEFEEYIYKKGTEDPVKENDHAMDSIRNFCYWTWGEEMETQEVVYDRVSMGDW